MLCTACAWQAALNAALGPVLAGSSRVHFCILHFQLCQAAVVPAVCTSLESGHV